MSPPLMSNRRRASASRFRPRFEGLEDRTVMSAVAVHAPLVHHAAVHHAAVHRAAVLHLPVSHVNARPKAVAAHVTSGHVAVAHRPAAHPRFGATARLTPVPLAPVALPPVAPAPAPAVVPAPAPAVAPPPAPTVAPAAPPAPTATTTTTAAPADPTLITLDLKPLDVNLLGLEVKTGEITVTVSAQPGSGNLLGNLLTDVANLLNLQGVNTALNNVLGSVVTLANAGALGVTGVNTGGPLGSTTTIATTPVLSAHVAPVNLNLLGAVVQTSPVDLSITAHSGPGLVLGNVVTDLANLLNTAPKKLDINALTTQLQGLLNELNAQVPNITAPVIAPSTPPTGTTQVLSLNVPPVNVNLLGLVLQTGQLQVNADANSGSGDLLGNLLTDLLNTLGATPQNLSSLNLELNALLGKVVAVLNASTLTLAPGALASLTPVLQTLALPNLVNPTGTASTPVLNLDIASSTSTPPPVDVNVLGLVVTTSNIHAQLVAQTGDGQVLGNMVYNVSHLLDPGGSLNLLTILNELGV